MIKVAASWQILERYANLPCQDFSQSNTVDGRQTRLPRTFRYSCQLLLLTEAKYVRGFTDGVLATRRYDHKLSRGHREFPGLQSRLQQTTTRLRLSGS